MESKNIIRRVRQEKLVKQYQGKDMLHTNYMQLDMFKKCPDKWYKVYVEGLKLKTKISDIRHKSNIISTLGMYFKDGCRANGEQMSHWFNSLSGKKPPEWDDVKDMLLKGREAWLVFDNILSIRDKGIQKKDLNAIEKLFYYGTPIEVEEKFEIEYKLPKPVIINDKMYDKVIITGSIGLILENEGKTHLVTFVYHMPSDEDLYFPISSFHMLRKYKKVPDSCFFYNIGDGSYKEVPMSMEIIKKATVEINDMTSKMYDFFNGDNFIKKYEYCTTCQFNSICK